MITNANACQTEKKSGSVYFLSPSLCFSSFSFVWLSYRRLYFYENRAEPSRTELYRSKRLLVIQRVTYIRTTKIILPFMTIYILFSFLSLSYSWNSRYGMFDKMRVLLFDVLRLFPLCSRFSSITRHAHLRAYIRNVCAWQISILFERCDAMRMRARSNLCFQNEKPAISSRREDIRSTFSLLFFRNDL